MLVAKLNDGRIVKMLKHNQDVLFSQYKQSLVNDNINAIPQRHKPYWVPRTSVVWVLDTKE